MAKSIKSKQFSKFINIINTSIDVVSGSFLPDTYNVGSSTLPWLSGSSTLYKWLCGFFPIC